MPPDPFADDPNDPASFLEPDEEFDPLSPEAMADLRADLESVARFRELLEPRGIRGVGMLCDDCDELHFYDWGILQTNFTAMLNNLSLPVHEPAVGTDPDHYVPWDYCVGFLDGVESMRGRRRP